MSQRRPTAVCDGCGGYNPPMDVRRYTVLLFASDEGFAISCPALPGCWSQGETEEQALENITDAIREYLLASGAPEVSVEERVIEVTV